MCPDTPLNPTPRTVDLRAGQLSYTTTGSGRPIVAIPGMPGTAHDFRWLGAAFASRVQFIRLNLPGFGASPIAGHKEHTVPEMASVVCEFCDTAELNDVIVLGHSMRGPIIADCRARAGELCGTGISSRDFPRDLSQTAACGRSASNM